jgi:hypothetical protein
MNTQRLFRLILLTFLVFQARPAHSHDASYPHHREDFEAITRRREMRIPVLIITAGFVAVLAGVFYTALRSGRDAEAGRHETESDRLERGVKTAARAARFALSERQPVEAAIRAALAAYAGIAGVIWRQQSLIVNGSSIRCKLGADVVVIRIFDRGDKYEIEACAAADGVNTRELCVLQKA